MAACTFGVGLGRGRRPPPYRDQIILGGIDRDTVQPGVKGAGALKRLELHVSLHEGVLDDVFRQCEVMDSKDALVNVETMRPASRRNR